MVELDYFSSWSTPSGRRGIASDIMNIFVNQAQQFKMGIEINSFHFSERKCQMFWSGPEARSSKDDLYSRNNSW